MSSNAARRRWAGSSSSSRPSSGYFIGNLVGQEPPSVAALLVIFMMVGLGLIGFIDDLMKVTRQNSLGLSGPAKIVATIIVSVGFSLLALGYRDANGVSPASTAISLVRDLPFLDLVAIFGVGLGTVLVIAWHAFPHDRGVERRQPHGRARRARRRIVDLRDRVVHHHRVLAAEPVVFRTETRPRRREPVLHRLESARSRGHRGRDRRALIGFLWWNTSPAQIMMGDTGSFGLGGALVALAILSRTELLLVLIGGLFVIVTGQVIVQRLYFKATRGKRIWRASPLHHHFEMLGWLEVTIVVRFWLIAGLFVASGIFLFYVEWLALIPW
jgi:phospho-N-acetylmuramoyl-pentapeptide-transferase